MSRSPVPPDIQRTAVRLCQELYRLDAGRTMCWHMAYAVAHGLDLELDAAQDAWRHAEARHWIAATGAPIHSVRLLAGGRRVLEQDSAERRQAGRRAADRAGRRHPGSGPSSG